MYRWIDNGYVDKEIVNIEIDIYRQIDRLLYRLMYRLIDNG